MTREFWAAVCGVANLFLFLFVVLKFAGTIAWSWWWVLSPLWIPAAVVAVVFLAIIIVCLLQR